MPPEQDNAPPQDRSVDDLPLAITRAVEKVEAGQTPSAAPAPDTSRPADAPSSGAEGGTPSSAGQTRDANGRFLPKPGPATDANGQPAAPAAPPAAGVGAPPATDTSSVAGQPAPTTDPLANAPASWTQEAKAKWGSVDEGIRREVIRREREIDRAMQYSAQRAQAASSILDEFAPYEQVLAQEGVSPPAAIRTLLQTAYALRSAGPEYRKAVFLDLAQQYGIDLTQGINPAQAQAEAQLTQYDIQQRAAYVQQQQEQAQHAAQVLAEFAAQPGHEHFDRVRPIMGNLLATGVVQDLETAYRQACILSPEIAPKLMEQAIAERMRVAQQAAAEQAAVAQQGARRAAAASSVGNSTGGGFASGPPGAPGTPDASKDLRGAIAAAMDRAGR